MSGGDNVRNLIDTMCSLVCSVEETRKKLNAAKFKLDQACVRNENINRILERCAADMKLSEKLVQHVQSSVETMIQTQAA